MVKFSKYVVGVVIFLLLICFYTLGSSLSLGSLAGYDNVYKKNWGNICCVQEDDYDIDITRWADDVPVSRCDHYTNECTFILTSQSEPFLTGGVVTARFDVCDFDNKNCNSRSYRLTSKGSTYSFVVPYGKEVRFSDSQAKYYTYTKRAKSFYIKGQENGKIYRQESCVLDSDLKGRVLNDGLNELSKQGANNCQNYMIDFVSVASKTYSYKGNEVICQARQVYDVDSQAFKDGSVRKVQGDLISSVECCPAEANCNEDTFSFVDDNVRECIYDSECANGGDPVAVTGTSYVDYECVDNKCVKSNEKYIDCTNTAVCIQKYGENSVCDLSPENWGSCKLNTKQESFCGDGLCETILFETKTSCPADCGYAEVNSGLAWYCWFLIVVSIMIFLLMLIKIVK